MPEKLKFLLIITFVAFGVKANAQDKQLKRIAIYDIDIAESRKAMLQTSFSPEKRKALRSIPEYLISYYSKSDQFITIDNIRQQLITDEKERQKSEEFIDGYVVEQGKLEGYDYIFFPRYFEKDNDVYVRVYDVANESVFCEVTEKADVGLFLNVEKVAMKLIDGLNGSCFSFHVEVVRSADSKPGKKEVKSLLILAGSNQQIKKGYEYEIFQKEIEVVGDKSFERIVHVGEGEIEEVEDENFSILKVKKGGDDIKGLLESGTTLYCRMLKND